MEVEQGKVEKKSSLLKKLEKYLSFKRRRGEAKPRGVFGKSKSLQSSAGNKATSGCFPVYVGAEKQRFVIKTEFANHPLFKMLLEDAELEYGFKNEGPLLLPCDVDLFWRVLAEMDSGTTDADNHSNGFACGGSCSPFTSKNGRSYALLTPPRFLKINHV